MDELTEHYDYREKKQTTTHFKVKDFIKYIFNEIWSKKNIGLLYTYYSPVLKGFKGSQRLFSSCEEYIHDVIHKLAAFPDAKIEIHDIITSGNDQEGYKTSTRWTLKAKHHGPTIYSDESQQNITISGISFNFIKINPDHSTPHNYFNGAKVVEHYMFYNELQLAKQLNTCPYTLVKRSKKNLTETDSKRFIERRLNSYPIHPKADDVPIDSVEELIQGTVNTVLNHRLLGMLDTYYSSSFQYHGCEEMEVCDLKSYQSELLKTLSLFPDSMIHIDEMIWEGNDDKGYLASVMWTLLGTHEGFGKYGSPTHTSLCMMGISHYLIKKSKVEIKWTAYNELDVLRLLELQPSHVKKDMDNDREINICEDTYP